MGVGAERPKTWGGSSQKLGRIDRIWGGCGADRPVPFTDTRKMPTRSVEKFNCNALFSFITEVNTGPHFDDELKGVSRANYPQLTKEMNPSRRS